MINKTFYVDTLREQGVKKFMEKYPEFDLDMFLKIAKSPMVTEDVRGLCTSLNFYGAERDAIIKIHEVLNKQFSEWIDSDLYLMYSKIKENVPGYYENYAYVLLQLGGYCPHIECRALKSAVYLIHDYIGKPINIEDVDNISNLYRGMVDWELAPDTSVNSEGFSEIDKCLTEQWVAWEKFTNFLLSKDLDSAYKMLLNYQEDCIRVLGSKCL